jgi:hypothetical protein
MSHWWREVCGWALVAIGLLTFFVTYVQFLSRGLIFESGPLTFIGFIVFRGGIHLLKVAVAAQSAGEAVVPAPRAAPAVPMRSPVVGQKPPAVVPGPAARPRQAAG